MTPQRNWYHKVLERGEGRTLRERGVPEELIAAVEIIEEIYIELLARGRVEPLSPEYPRGTPTPRWFARMMPPYWELRPPAGITLDLEIGYRTEQERERGEAERAEWWQQWRETRELYDEASRAHQLIAPIIYGEEHLNEQLTRIAMSGGKITDSETLRAIMAYRNALYDFCKPGGRPNPVVAAYLFRLDQGIDRIADEFRRIALKRIFTGELSDEQRREMIAALETQAERGLRPDPDADIAWAEAQVA